MPEASDDAGILLDAFNLKPREAAAYFDSKGLAYSWDWTDTWKDAHTRAFTVAKAMRLDVLQSIHDEVSKAVSQGTSFQDFQNTLTPRLKSLGWWGKAPDPTDPSKMIQLGSPARLGTIFNTNTQSAFQAGRWKKFIDMAAQQGRKDIYVQYVAVLDNRTRPAHRALSGKIFRIDDPALKIIAPPNGFNCRCTLVIISQGEMDREKLKAQPTSKIISQEVLVSHATGEMRTVQGVELHGGMRFFPDAGFDYNPGEKEWAPDLDKYDPSLAAAYKKAPAAPKVTEPPEAEKEVKGLAQRIPVKTIADMSLLLKTFDKENPGNFAKGFKGVVQKNSRTAMMAMYQDGRLVVSDAPTASGFRPWTELKTAMEKIRTKKPLNFREEYSIESVWHEIGHARSKGWVKTTKGGAAHLTMETLNQFVARWTYPEFLAALGGTATNQAAILKEGIGYSYWVTNFRSLLAYLDIDEAAALAVLQPVSVNALWTDIPTEVSEQLATLKKDPSLKMKIRRVLGHLDTWSPDAFQARLKETLGDAQ